MKNHTTFLYCSLAAMLLFGCRHPRTGAARSEDPSGGIPLEGQTAVLNDLRDEVNFAYGYKDGVPRINFGPCGRFAKAFRERWDARFPNKVNLAFVMSPDRKRCYHVLVKLPGGLYFDGGNGVISGRTLLRQYPAGTRLDEMQEFDLQVLDERSHGLNRRYEDCPNYADEITLKLIDRHLSQLPRDTSER